MNYVKSLDLFGVPVQQIPSITGSGAPTTSTEGAVGCFYMDTASENVDIYKCIAVVDGAYIWKEFKSGSVKSVNGISPDENGNVQIETGGGSAEGAVLYLPQDLPPEKKAQARSNIDAVGVEIFNSRASGNYFDATAMQSGMLHTNGKIFTGDSYASYVYFENYIPVSTGERLSMQWDDGSTRKWSEDGSSPVFKRVVAYDSDKNVLSDLGANENINGEIYYYDVPETVAYIRITVLASFMGTATNIDIVKNATNILPHEAFGEGGKMLKPEYYDEDYLKELTDAQMQAELGIEPITENSKNLIDMNAVTTGGWHYNGRIEMYPNNQYVQNYCFTDYMPVVGGEKYVLSAVGAVIDQNTLHSFNYYDKDKNFISYTPNEGAAVSYYVFDIPTNAAYLVINCSKHSKFLSSKLQLERGNIPTEYEDFYIGATVGYYLNGLMVKPNQIEAEAVPKILHLPEKYNLVVGDTFELFYKGIMLCKDPYHYNILVTCGIGNTFARKFVVTPTEAGTHTLTVQLTDDFGNVIDEASTQLVVSSKMASPAEQMNVLCVGDSLTAGGQWVDEVYRRLTKTTSATQHNATAPTGDGLSNIAFVGKKTTANGAGYEGTGGWTYNSYLDTSNADNPFLYNGSVDFSAYCAELGIDVIDRCYILLGWNMATNTEAVFKEKAKAFIDLLIAHNPAVKITLVGVEIPAYDGLGSNYSVTSAYSKYRALQEFVFNLDKWNADIADTYPNNVSTLSIAGQFDTENCMPTITEKVNIRSAKDNTVQNNGIHPANEGYYQIADAVYRKFTADNK